MPSKGQKNGVPALPTGWVFSSWGEQFCIPVNVLPREHPIEHVQTSARAHCNVAVLCFFFIIRQVLL